MAVEFRIDDEAVDATTHLVKVAGEIDLFTAPQLKERIAAPVDAGKRRVIVDLSEVRFIDSSSLGVLIGAHRLERDGGGLVIVCDDRSIVNTFKITGLDGLFEIVRSRDDVVTAG